MRLAQYLSVVYRDLPWWYWSIVAFWVALIVFAIVV